MDVLSLGMGCVIGASAAGVAWLLSSRRQTPRIAVEPAPEEVALEEPAAVPEAVFHLDRHGRVDWASAVARGLFGRGIVGAPFTEVLPDWDGLAGFRTEKRISSSGQEIGVSWTLEARTPGGDPMPVRVHRAPTSGGFWVVLHDLTTQARGLERITKANARLQASRDDARRESQGKTAYLARVAQALRTPLNTIKGYGELLDEELTERELTALVGDIRRLNAASDTLRIILENVLDWTELEAGRMSVENIVFDLGDAVRRGLADGRPGIEQRGNTLEIDLPEGLRVRGDADRTTQILCHLLRNAGIHTRDGTVTVHARRWDDRVAVSVRDTGVGMEAGELEELFVDFTRRSSRADHAGAGISLLLAHTFAKMMGGELTVNSAPGKGSTFTLVLPGIDETEYAPPMMLD